MKDTLAAWPVTINLPTINLSQIDFENNPQSLGAGRIQSMISKPVEIIQYDNERKLTTLVYLIKVRPKINVRRIT